MTETTALTRRDGALSDEDIQLIKKQVCPDQTPDREFEMFIRQCNRTGLDPLHKQIYLLKVGGKFHIMTSIDGARLTAQRSGQYEGQVGPYWCGDDGEWSEVWPKSKGSPVAAKVGVLRKGAREPTWGVAHWDEYQGTGPVWKTKPRLMLAKCFDNETEVLTTNGFKLFEEMEPEDQVLQVDENGLSPVKAEPFVQQYDGPMVTLDSDDLNFRVTPNHDMVTATGTIEAGDMYDSARARPKHWIPRCVSGSSPQAGMTDNQLKLAAAFVADGHRVSGKRFKVSVSRPRKVRALESMGEHRKKEAVKRGHKATGRNGRVIETRHDKTAFTYESEKIDSMVDMESKAVPGVRNLSRRQARVFVDALMFFDGHTQQSGVRRFYTSNPDVRKDFEIAAVKAGYAISPWRERTSDISERPNYHCTISSRNEIPVIRWGRKYKGKGGNERERTGLELTHYDGGVWCVTVPSGQIVVRRKGFSMVCGNCAEALALRKAFPQELSSLYTREELEQAQDEVRDVTAEGSHQLAKPKPKPKRTRKAKPKADPDPLPSASARPVEEPAEQVDVEVMAETAAEDAAEVKAAAIVERAMTRIKLPEGLIDAVTSHFDGHGGMVAAEQYLREVGKAIGTDHNKIRQRIAADAEVGFATGAK